MHQKESIMSNIHGLKGTQDYWPQQTALWQHIEKIMIHTISQWGYHEVRTPIIEPESVFIKMGQDTDVIGKQMYRIAHDKEAIVLRPEGTSSVVRSGLEHHMITRSHAKVWYMGPMFRHERPQKGRLREFHQCGGEAFGYSSTSMDVDMLDMLITLIERLGIAHLVQLEINTLGSVASRTRYKQALVDYLTPLYDKLDEDSQRRLSTNPLRIFDSKSPTTQELMMHAPLLHEYLHEEELQRHQDICQQLDALGHTYTINPRLVRGLDYYNDLVFEFTTTSLGAQGTLCAGGRFDHLTAQWGYAAIPAIGFSIGMERILALLENIPPTIQHPKPIIAFTSVAEAHIPMLQLLHGIRHHYDGPVHYDVADTQFKNKYTRALKSDPLAIITIEQAQYTAGTCSLRIPHRMPQDIARDAQEIMHICLTL